MEYVEGDESDEGCYHTDTAYAEDDVAFLLLGGDDAEALGKLEQGVARQDCEEADSTNHVEGIANTGGKLECSNDGVGGRRTREKANTECEHASECVQHIVNRVVAFVAEEQYTGHSQDNHEWGDARFKEICSGNRVGYDSVKHKGQGTYDKGQGDTEPAYPTTKTFCVNHSRIPHFYLLLISRKK